MKFYALQIIYLLSYLSSWICQVSYRSSIVKFLTLQVME